MEGNLSSAKKQKANRLDLLGAKLQIRAAQASQAISNGILNVMRPPVAHPGICLECGGMAIGAEICGSCAGNARTQVQSGPGLVCPVCSILVLNAAGARFCTACKSMVHHECDRTEPAPTGFVCVSCRKSPLVGDVMLGARDPISPLQPVPSAQAVIAEALANSATLNPFASVHLQGVVGDFQQEIYHHLSAADIPSPATTSDSTRNSPFYPENSPSDVDEDFVPGRGRGGKKKPGRGVMKTRSGGKPPTGAFLDKVGQSTRGKRGKRGGSKMGNGKAPANTGTRGRGRGRPSPSMNQQPVTSHAFFQQLMMQQHQLQQQQQQQQHPSIIREVDEHLIEETARTDRSEDAEYVRTVVICDAADQFLQKACLCLVCGSVGKDRDSSMVACSNCAQTYHTYCVGLHDKMNSTVVTRGWRCLDCMVCEGCGEGKDEAKLIVCEDCDVSFHIYCLNPPLEKVPADTWRCQWCARCRRCKSRVGGTELTKEGLCTTCFSLRKCPKCTKLYQIGDKIIRCSACLRWYHGTCEDLYNDEMLEQASQSKMRCSACRPSARNFGNMMSFEGHANLIVCDNVALNKTADEILQSKFMPGLFRQDSFGNLGTGSFGSFDHYGSVDDDYNLMSDEYDMLASGGRGRGMGRGGGPGRKVPKLGVGGFFVKIPRHRVLANDDEIDDEGNKKQKRPRKPRRSQLEDAYPPAIQEGFFGMRPVEGKNLLDTRVEEPQLDGEVGSGGASTSTGHELSHEATEILRNDLNEADILENIDLGDINIDEMDFNNWMDDDDDDGEFDDSLNDAMDLIKTDIAESPKPTTSTSQDLKPGTFFGQIDVKPIITPQQKLSALPASVSRPGGKEERQSQERSEIARWEEDEPLGLQATKAAVLYANAKHPQLKEQYPEWIERVKHIQRLWRTLDSENRQEFVNRARENRANRGKQPRVRKIASTQSVDSPTIQSPAPSFYRQGMMDDRFKVPNMPMGMGPGPSQMRPDFYQQQQMQQMNQEPQTRQVKVTSHLTPNEAEVYLLMNRRSEDLRKHQEVLEQELAKMRKQKKNLTAKKRQMAKNAAVDNEGKPINVELVGPDKENLEELPSRISLKSKDLDNCKRDIKTHAASVQDFETKHNIIRTVPVNGPDHNDMLRMQMNHAAPPGVVPVPHPMGAPVQHAPPAVFPHQVMGQQMGQHPQMHPQHFQQMRVPQQVPYGMQQQPMAMPMRQPMRPMRTPKMGGIFFEQLQSPFDREIYETLDDIITRVQMQLEPVDPRISQEEANQSGVLKRMLEPPPAHNLAALHQAPPPSLAGAGSHLMELDPPRAKKKRTQPKKPGMAGNEYELMVERVETQLRLIQQLPRQALEPAPRNPGAAFATMGISDLPDRPHKKATQGYTLGEMSLTFVEDFFSGEERGPIGALATIPSANELACPLGGPPVNAPPSIICQNMVAILKQCSLPEDYEIISDKEDVRFSLADPMGMIIASTGRYSIPGHIRVANKIQEMQQPLEPHRSVFHEEKESVEDVEISMVIKADPKHVMDSVQKMLELGQVISFEMDTPPMSPEARIEAELPSTSKRDPNSVPAMGGKCRGCDMQMHSATVQSSMSQLGLTPSDDGKDDSVCFCSMKCYYRFVAQSKVALSPDQLLAAEQHVDEETMAQLKQISAESFAKCMTQGKVPPSVPSLPSDALLTSPRDTRYVIDEGRKDQIQIVRVSDLAALQEVTARREVNAGPSEDWMTFNNNILQSYIRISEIKQGLINAPKMGLSLSIYHELDQRVCVFCGGKGDGEPSACGRLLNLCANIWVHVNCALWSAEVYENPNGGLLQVDQAVVRASGQVCHLCGRRGASIQCHKADCGLHFHLPCAKNIKGKFVKDKTFFCSRHLEISMDVLVVQLDAPRRIYIERNETALLGKLFDTESPRLCMKLGAHTFFKVGQLLPDQLKAFHNNKYIYPNGFSISRWFWSPTDAKERVLYECVVAERNQKPLFVVTLGEQRWEAETATGAWSEVMVAVKKARTLMGEEKMLQLFPQAEQGETLYGLGESAVTKITESLPGVDSLFTYTFRHQNSPLLELPLAENPSGCARAEPRFRTLIKYRPRPGPSAVVASAPRPSASGPSNTESGRTRGASRTSSFDELAQAQLKLMAQGGGGDWTMLLGNKYDLMVNNSSTYSLYQKMKRDIDQTVYLARSKIQGLGLFSKRDINMGDMIIEYKGEIIRNEVCNVREKKYVAQNRGVYMFRIDDEIAVDATMCGGMARYINHSCDPNCSTKVIAAGPALEDKKIVITANRPIKAREELTYDYQFEYEDDTTKIPCLCGAPNCVKWMN